jgi:hypothetical protein
VPEQASTTLWQIFSSSSFADSCWDSGRVVTVCRGVVETVGLWFRCSTAPTGIWTDGSEDLHPLKDVRTYYGGYPRRTQNPGAGFVLLSFDFCPSVYFSHQWVKVSFGDSIYCRIVHCLVARRNLCYTGKRTQLTVPFS